VSSFSFVVVSFEILADVVSHNGEIEKAHLEIVSVLMFVSKILKWLLVKFTILPNVLRSIHFLVPLRTPLKHRNFIRITQKFHKDQSNFFLENAYECMFH
jgi:hypothetical protein